MQNHFGFLGTNNDLFNSTFIYKLPDKILNQFDNFYYKEITNNKDKYLNININCDKILNTIIFFKDVQPDVIDLQFTYKNDVTNNFKNNDFKLIKDIPNFDQHKLLYYTTYPLYVFTDYKLNNNMQTIYKPYVNKKENLSFYIFINNIEFVPDKILNIRYRFSDIKNIYDNVCPKNTSLSSENNLVTSTQECQHAQSSENKNNIVMYSIIGILAFIILVLIIVIINKYKCFTSDYKLKF